MVKKFQDKIHDANIAVHEFEARYYEVIHPEVFGQREQKRLDSILRVVDGLIGDNRRKALDFGVGTGNLTGKLLDMGYEVVAVDICEEMCKVLEMKYGGYLEGEKLTIINSAVEDLSFKRGEFDLIAGYSVLHHLPDYVETIQRLSVFLKKGGVMYLDHEASPFYWESGSNMLANLVKLVYFHSNPILNSLYFQAIGVDIPSLDYNLSDYWHKKEHPLNHKKIENLFQKENFEFFARIDYHQHGTWIPNPIFYIYRHTCRPEMSVYIAKK